MSKSVQRRSKGLVAFRDDALTSLRGALEKQRPRGGSAACTHGGRRVADAGRQLEDFLKEFPEAHGTSTSRSAATPPTAAPVLAFGEYVNTYYDFRKADVVLSLDADFLTCGPGNLRYVADFMARRRVRTTAADAGQAQMNRLYVVETAVSSTGAKADHRLALRARRSRAWPGRSPPGSACRGRRRPALPRCPRQVGRCRRRGPRAAPRPLRRPGR